MEKNAAKTQKNISPASTALSELARLLGRAAAREWLEGQFRPERSHKTRDRKEAPS